MDNFSEDSFDDAFKPSTENNEFEKKKEFSAVPEEPSVVFEDDKPLKSHGVYLALAIFLGWLGIHDLYIERRKAAGYKIILFLAYMFVPTSFGLGFMASMIVGTILILALNVWVLVDIFMTINYPWKPGTQRKSLAKILVYVLGFLSVVAIGLSIFAQIKVYKIMSDPDAAIKQMVTLGFATQYYESCYNKIAAVDENAARICDCASASVVNILGVDFIVEFMKNRNNPAFKNQAKRVSDLSKQVYNECKSSL